MKGLQKLEEPVFVGGSDTPDGCPAFIGGLPENTDASLVYDFIRVLQAEKPSEVDDLSDDRILQLMGTLGELSECIEVDNRFTNGQLVYSLRNTKGIVRRRRVL